MEINHYCALAAHNKDFLLNFVALVRAEKLLSDSDSSDDDDGEEIDVKKRYHKLYDQCMKLSHENIQLIKDTSMLKAQVNLLTIQRIKRTRLLNPEMC